jgi:outer membrane lipoprotein SlyB
VIGIIPGVENMPLQIRRGTDAERLAMTQPLAQGELLYVTNDQRLYIGNGSTLGGIQITGYTNEDAQDAAAQLFSNGAHTGITFTYNDASASISAALNLSNFSGTITADAFKGSVFGDDSTPIVDAINNTINGNVNGNVTGNLSGTVTGNVIGNVTGNVIGNVTGNLAGNVVGDVTGSVFADDSTMLINSTNGTINGLVLTDVLAPIVSVVRNNTTGFGLSLTGLASASDSSVGIEFQSSRGSTSSPTNHSLADSLFTIAGKPWKTDQAGYVLSTIIFGEVDGAYGAGDPSVPSKLVFGASNGTRAADDAAFVMTYNGSGVLSAPTITATTAFQLPVYANDTARLAAIPTPAKGMMVFMTAGTSPAITNATVIYNGSSWLAL